MGLNKYMYTMFFFLNRPVINAQGLYNEGKLSGTPGFWPVVCLGVGALGSVSSLVLLHVGYPGASQERK